MKRNLIWAVVIVSVALIAFIVYGLRATHAGTSDAELTSLAKAVPVPAGVTLSSSPESHQTVEQGLIERYRLVNVHYHTNLTCDELLLEWETLLQASGRHFTQALDTNTSSLTLKLVDTPVPVGIFMGNPTSGPTGCTTPSVGAFGTTFRG